MESPTNDKIETPPGEETLEQQDSLFQPVKHFLLLCLLSFGSYLFFWFYKHWRYLKDEKEMDISPGFRSLLIVFTGYSLFRDFKKLAAAEGYKTKAPYGILFLLLCLVFISIRVEDISPLFFLIAPLSFTLLVPAVVMMNFYYLHAHPHHRIRKKLGIDEIVFLLAVWVILLLAGFSS
ncbi:MAG: hypothetical protein V4635_04040 [Bacteroidota bacterium]